MVIKNIGNKIVNIGTNMILPDASLKVNDSVVNSPAVKALIKRGMLKVETENAGEEPKEEESTTDTEKEETPKPKRNRKKASVEETVVVSTEVVEAATQEATE